MVYDETIDNYIRYLEGQWDGTTIRLCTIITTSACRQTAHLHHRMPIVLDAEFHVRWLDPELNTPDILTEILKSGKVQKIIFYPVSTEMNSTMDNYRILLESITL